MRERFWERFSLTELDTQEWEALCDGCGRCCLIKLQDEDTEQLCYTDVACRYLDISDCRCSAYSERTRLVEDCVKVTPAIAAFDWLPSTCAYRLLAHGQQLPVWHPLLTGQAQSVEDAGISVRNRVLSESEVSESELEDHIIDL